MEELKDQTGQESNPEIRNKRKLPTHLGLEGKDGGVTKPRSQDYLGPVKAGTTQDTQLRPKIFWKPRDGEKFPSLLSVCS